MFSFDHLFDLVSLIKLIGSIKIFQSDQIDQREVQISIILTIILNSNKIFSIAFI